MKKECFLMAAALSAAFCHALAECPNCENPESIPYYIDGYFSQTEDGQYRLTDITSKGITFDKPLSGMVMGKEVENGQVQFSFARAETSFPSQFIRRVGKESVFDFWVNRDLNQRWLCESEVYDGKMQEEDNKFTCIMLVIDCSKSIGGNFQMVKASARNFITKLYQSRNHNNIHLGIISFSSQTNDNSRYLEIGPLTDANYQNSVVYVDNLMMDYGTALYFAMDYAIDRVDDYVRTLRKKDPTYFNRVDFEQAHIISFTDGIDNTSRLPNQKFFNASQLWENNPYYQHVKRKFENVRIGGKNISSHLVVVKSPEIEGNEKNYERVAKGITSFDESGKLQYYLLNNFAELNDRFNDIVNNLTTRWQNLTLYVPRNSVGHVRWTLGDCKKEEVYVAPTPAPAPQPKCDYTGGIGIVVGNLYGLSFKHIPSYNHFAWSLDLVARLSIEEIASMEGDVNFLYQNNVRNWSSCCLQWFVGGGASLGYGLENDAFKIGVNAIAGMELIWHYVPLSLSVDLRPGYAMCDGSYLDFGCGISLRYIW